MDIINQLVLSLSKDEIRYFKIFATRMADADDRKDLQLFDYIRQSGAKYDEGKIAGKLYGAGNKDSFYRLKNRLLDYTSDFLTFHHIWKSDNNTLLRLLALYNIFLRKNQIELAHFYLKKAEVNAIKSEDFEMLDVIYGHFVKLSIALTNTNPEDYMQLRSENAARLNKIRQADQAIAALSYRLKLTQNFASGKSGALQILNETVKEFTNDESLKKSKSFQSRIYRAVSQTLLQQHNYPELELFLKQTFKRFETERWFDEENHEMKLQMLTYLVNSLFRNGKYNESLEYANMLGTEIKAFNNLLYDQYLFFYYNSLVINYSALDAKKALSILKQFEQEIRNKKNSYYDHFLYFNKALLLHQSGKPAEALFNIVKLYVNDNYQKAGDAFKLKISVSELIMQFDAGDFESYKLRSKEVKKQFAVLLNDGDFIRDIELIRLMDKMASTASYKRNAELKREAELYVSRNSPALVNDSEIINYSQWLSGKWGIQVTNPTRFAKSTSSQ